jgi:hypothetical protein
MVDVLEQWWSPSCYRFPKVRTLPINQDNVPENRHGSKETPFR